MLLDSNIIIYASQPDYAQLREFIAEHNPLVSVVSYIEVLGYHRHPPEQLALYEAFFANAEVLPISMAIVEVAVALRQQRRMTLGDALIAGTALVYELTLVTRNVEDFRWVEGLIVMNPLAGDDL